MKGTSRPPFPRRLARLLLGNTVLLFGVYCYFVMRLNINWIFWIYYVLLAASAIAYFAYNRAFTREGITLFDLPDTMSAAEKEAFIRDRDERKKKSKWLLTIIFPLCLTVFFDIIYLFFGERIVSFFSSFPSVFGGA